MLACAGWASALSVAGKDFSDHIRLADADLVLNGVGVRAVAWIKGFAAGLYLTEKAEHAHQVLSAPGPKRVRMVMLMDASASEFSKAVRGGVRKNSADADWVRLQKPVDELGRVIDTLGTLKSGDVVDLDFAPAHGVTLKVNGHQHGAPVASSDLYGGILKIFVGEQPVDQRLKAGLLGRRAP